MALFDDATSLEDVLGRQAEAQTGSIQDQFAKRRRQAVSQQARAGRLGSGVANYTFGDIGAQELGALGNVQAQLAQSLGQIPVQDYLREQDFRRNYELSKLIASLSEPSALQEAFTGLGAAGNLASTVGAFF